MGKTLLGRWLEKWTTILLYILSSYSHLQDPEGFNLVPRWLSLAGYTTVNTPCRGKHSPQVSLMCHRNHYLVKISDSRFQVSAMRNEVSYQSYLTQRSLKACTFSLYKTNMLLNKQLEIFISTQQISKKIVLRRRQNHDHFFIHRMGFVNPFPLMTSWKKSWIPIIYCTQK